jgi:DNA polymerase-4/DNA polymerase V
MILHVDGDSFFASCEVALNPKLKGKPVVTGQERGIVSAMTYEAKRLGIHRGMRIFEVRQLFPQVIVVASNYETYSIFSHRMFAIVRRYALKVEEYSIDECFADLSGLPEKLNLSYTEIGKQIKHDLESHLGLTVSVGIAPSKVLAKIASTWKKPSGFTVIEKSQIEGFLRQITIEKVWGIGGQTSLYLRKQGIQTAFDLASKNKEWVEEKMNKSGWEIWLELQGVIVHCIHAGNTDQHKSIQKTRTFKPPSSNRAFLFSQLSKNIENACVKARQCGLIAGEISFFLKTQDFRYYSAELELSLPVNTPEDILKAVSAHFHEVYLPGTLYRASGITLRKMSNANNIQSDLFGQTSEIESFSKVYEKIDELSRRYGKHAVFLGSSLKAMHATESRTSGDYSRNRSGYGQYETGRNGCKHLAIPIMGEVF